MLIWSCLGAVAFRFPQPRSGRPSRVISGKLPREEMRTCLLVLWDVNTSLHLLTWPSASLQLSCPLHAKPRNASSAEQIWFSRAACKPAYNGPLLPSRPASLGSLPRRRDQGNAFQWLSDSSASHRAQQFVVFASPDCASCEYCGNRTW